MSDLERLLHRLLSACLIHRGPWIDCRFCKAQWHDREHFAHQPACIVGSISADYERLIKTNQVKASEYSA